MTRETKIGLLVGLGFIVVFAMLLSHSAPAPSPGDSLQLAKARSEAAGKLQRPVERTPIDVAITPSTAQSRTDSPAVSDTPVQGSDLAPLPNPVALDPPVVNVAVNESPRTEAADAASTGAVLEMTRMAPALPEPIAEPQETARPETPVVSPQPVQPAPVEPARVVPSPVPPPAKEYVVQKGETLGHIAKAVYGTSSPKVMDFLVSANKKQIKNRNSVIEGQKLSVPQLPPDMFEAVGTNLNVARPDTAQASKINDMINRPGKTADKPAPEKTAPPSTVTRVDPPLSAETLQPILAPAPTPQPVKTDLTLKPEKAAPAIAKAIPENAGREVRVYEVRSKETFSSIAREQLGSTTLWKEIARLNKGVDPSKLKPGTKLKLPTRRPLVDSVAAGKST